MKDTEQIAKLPVWAQEHIARLERERSTAIRALNGHVDNQKPSKVYWEEYLSTGEGNSGGPSGPTNKRFYVQTDRIVVEHSGILLRIDCHSGERLHDNGIDLRWTVAGGSIDMVAFVPKSFQQAVLVAHENMRVQMSRKRPPLAIS